MGVPFAKPPVGPLRFKRPETVEPWQGTFDATKTPKPCLQVKIFSLAMIVNFSRALKTS